MTYMLMKRWKPFTNEDGLEDARYVDDIVTTLEDFENGKLRYTGYKYEPVKFLTEEEAKKCLKV